MKLKHNIIALALSLLTSLHSAAVEKLIIVNEGGWDQNNGQLSYFEDGTIKTNSWFLDVNGTTLGDTPNDIIQISNDLIAITINTSNIVQFITPEGKDVAATEDIPNNRRMACDGKYLYVTSYGHECLTTAGTVKFTKGFVAKIDVTTFKVVATCEVGYEPEGIAYHNGYLYVANSGGYSFSESHDYETTVSIIKAESMSKLKDVDTGRINLYGMAKSGKYLCISSLGDHRNISAATIIFDCEAALSSDDCFTVLDKASTYSCTATDGQFYVIGSQYSYNTYKYTFNYTTINPSEAIATKGAGGFSESLPGTVLDYIKKMSMPYGIYVNPYTGYIYATDAASFSGAGALYQWTPSGEYVDKYKVYINPGHFLALPPDGNFDSVKNVECDAPAADDTYYNLQGIRVTNPTAGQIYIHRGKKIIF